MFIHERRNARHHSNARPSAPVADTLATEKTVSIGRVYHTPGIGEIPLQGRSFRNRIPAHTWSALQALHILPTLPPLAHMRPRDSLRASHLRRSLPRRSRCHTAEHPILPDEVGYPTMSQRRLNTLRHRTSRRRWRMEGR